MAYEGKSPDQDWIQMNPRTTEPKFPALPIGDDDYKEGTLFVSKETSSTATFYPPGLYVYIRNNAGTAFNWEILTPNTNATLINAGNLGAEYGGVPCGTVLPFAKDVSSTGLPTGYLFCDGSSVSQSSFANLYAVIGTAFGDGTTGTGSTATGNFNIPDFRGYFLRGMDHAQAHDPNSPSRTTSAPGGASGDNVGSYQADEFKFHSHNTTAVRHSGSPWNTPNEPGPQSNSVTQASTTTGGDETRPKNIYVDYIIRYL